MIDFNKHFALLYYGMAMSDGNIELKEKEEIFKIINAVDIMEHSDDEKEEMYSILRDAISKDMNSDDAFSTFKGFYTENKNFFDKTLKSQILQAIDSIALASHGRNKSESVFYSKVHLLFEN